MKPTLVEAMRTSEGDDTWRNLTMRIKKALWRTTGPQVSGRK
jgi:hypothetical protein